MNKTKRWRQLCEDIEGLVTTRGAPGSAGEKPGSAGEKPRSTGERR